MLIKPLRPDWRIGRNWRRYWRDRAGFFGPGYRKCKCCAPSSPICAYNTACCNNMPAVTHITFSNSGLCPVLDGNTFQLNIGPCTAGGLHTNGTCSAGGADRSSLLKCSWVYQGACTGATLQIQVGCQAAGEFVIGFYGLDCCSGVGSYVATTITCSPLTIVWNCINPTIPSGGTNKCTGCNLGSTCMTATLTV